MNPAQIEAFARNVKSLCTNLGVIHAFLDSLSAEELRRIDEAQRVNATAAAKRKSAKHIRFLRRLKAITQSLA